MSRKTKGTGVTRRDFVKTVGLAGIAVAGAGVPGAMAAPEPPAGAAPAGTTPRRKLGKTGVEVSILNLGGMFDTINNQLLLKQALKWGVTYWDTAESYGNGLSEEGMGRFFARNPEARKEIFLVTKVHQPKGDDLTERLDKCLKRLQTDHVDLFFIHAITGIDEMKPAYKDWAAEMKKAGKFKFFGFSTHTNMEDCLSGAAKLDWIDAVMFTYNFRVMHDPKMKAALNACEKAGVGLVAMKSMAGGPGEPKDRQPGQAGNGRPLPETGLHGQAGQAQGDMGEPPNRQPLLPDAQPDHPVGQRGRGPGPDQTGPGGVRIPAPVCPGDPGRLLRRLRQPLPGGRGRGRAGERSHALPHVPPVLWRTGAGPADLRRAARGGSAAVD